MSGRDSGRHHTRTSAGSGSSRYTSGSNGQHASAQRSGAAAGHESSRAGRRWTRRRAGGGDGPTHTATNVLEQWANPLSNAAEGVAADAAAVLVEAEEQRLRQQQLQLQLQQEELEAAAQKQQQDGGTAKISQMAKKLGFGAGKQSSSNAIAAAAAAAVAKNARTDAAASGNAAAPPSGPQTVTFSGVAAEDTSSGTVEARNSRDHRRPADHPHAAPGKKQTAAGSASTAPSKIPPVAETPQESAVVTRVRQLARRCLALSQRSDWMAVEQTLKSLERAAVEAGVQAPLDGVVDELGYSPLMYVAKENRVMLVERLVEAGCNVNLFNKEGFSVLHIAVLYAREDMVKTLFNMKADVTALTGPKKMTCVHLVCTRMASLAVNILRMLLQTSHKDIRLIRDVYLHPGSSAYNHKLLVKQLLTCDTDGNIPLFLAIEAGSHNICKELMNFQPELQVKVRRANQDTVVHMATRRRDVELVRLFVEHNVPVDAQNKDGQTALHIAAADGDENLTKFFYNVHADANIPDNEDRTPLHIASERGHAVVVELLADKFRASVMDRTRDGSTLMHIASLNGHPEAVMAFLRKGVPLQMPNKAGERAIHTAAMAGHATVINTLIQRGEKVDAATKDNYTALHLAVKEGNPSVVETLLGHGAQVEIRGGQQKETPLHIAARVRSGDRCVEMLLKSGASIKLVTQDGQTPLHLSCFHGNLKTCELMLADKADPMAQSNSGETPLHLACKGTHYSVVQLLRDFVAKQTSAGSDPLVKLRRLVNMRNEDGETALHYAARVVRQQTHRQSEDVDIMKLLCENGGTLDFSTTKTKETPFHYVAKYGNSEVLKQMLHHLKEQVPNMQVVLNRQNASGASCLMLASHHGHYEVAYLLLENNVRVDVFDTDGKSALHLAGEKGYVDLCTTLLAHKAFVNARSKQGLTALHLAAMNGNNDLVKTLIDKHNASLDANTLAKQTPLHMAAEAGQLEVCRTLIQMKSNANATNDAGQKPIHLAAQENHSAVVKLFLKHFPELVNTADRGGNTCAHIAASKGSVDVIKELMKFNKQMVTSFHNKTSESTPLHMAAEGGHAEVVRVLVEAGASPTEENKFGMTPVHLAARNGKSQVLAMLRSLQVSMRLTSKKNGLSALHVAAYYGEAEIVRELLQHVPATLKSDTPAASGTSIIRELGSESGLTPLHMASYSGQENIVRLLMNSPGVLIEATTNHNAYVSLHLACVGGHTAVAGLLLSRSAEQLVCKDRRGRTSLHISAMNGHLAMVSQLLGQGAEINSIDRDGWTALHYAASNGHLDVVKQLIESGAPSKSKSNNDKIPLCLAVTNEHFDVIEYLLRKEHDSYELLSDKKFVSDLTMVSKKHGNKPLQDFILLSPAPVEVASKLSFILVHLSTKEKEKTRDLSAASRYCETMAADILSLAAGSKSAGMLLKALDSDHTEFLDVLIQLEQKEVIAHPAVQRYLNEVWIGQMEWSNYRTVVGILLFLFCPPVWMFFSLPLGHKYSRVPVVKFISQVVSHFYFIVLLTLTVVTPLWPIWVSTSLLPHPPEWLVFIWLSGMVLSELTNPGERTGLGILRIVSLVSGCLSIVAHLIGFAFSADSARHDVLYVRNQLLAVSMLFACVQLLDFLTFHHLFGPWTVIIKALMVDLGRFLVIMSIFVLGFSLHVAAIYQPVRPSIRQADGQVGFGYPPNEAPVQTPLETLEMMFFSIFGLIDTYDYLPPLNSHPKWSQTLIKIVFGTYMIVAVIVLINLLIAMMSDTYQRIQAKSDTEWKFGLAKLIRNTNRTSSAPTPLNLVTKLIIVINAFIIFRGRVCNSGALEYMKTEQLPKERRLELTAAGHAVSGTSWIGRLRGKSMTPGLALPSRARGSSSTADLIMDISQTQTSSASAVSGARKLDSVIDWSKLVAKYLDERNLPDDITTVNKYLSNTGQSSMLDKHGDGDDANSGDGVSAADEEPAANGHVV